MTVGLWAGGRFAQRDVLPDIVAAFTLYWPLTGQPGGELGAGKLASNGFDGASPGKFGMGAAFVAEVLLTAMLLMIIMGSTHKLAAAGAAPIAIGLALTLIHLISIPITNTSVNPARSAGLALVEAGVALQQLWLFARRDRLSDLAGRQRLTAMATKAEAPALYGAEAFFLSAADQPQWPFLSAQMLR